MDEFNVVHRTGSARGKNCTTPRSPHAMAVMDLQERMSKVSDCQEVVDVKCRYLKNSGAKFNDAKRKAEGAQGQVKVHRERCRRFSAVFRTAEEDLYERLGRLGQLIRVTAGATHALSCGTTDRDCHEVKYLQEAFEMIENFQRRDTRREVAEIMLGVRSR